jgi:predicted NBD/HSP70 family sugar kinase
LPQPDSPTIARNSPRARSKSTPSTATTREEARRVAVRIAPVAAVADVGLFVLGGGIGADADLLLEPIRPLLAEWLP